MKPTKTTSIANNDNDYHDSKDFAVNDYKINASEHNNNHYYNVTKETIIVAKTVTIMIGGLRNIVDCY